MATSEKPVSQAGRQSAKLTLLFTAAGILAGLYAALVASVSDYRVALVLVAAPVALAVLGLKGASRIYLIILVVSLSFGARFRFGVAEVHQGGAEAVLAPLDFPLFGLLFLWLAELITRPQRLTFRVSRVGIAFFLLVLAYYVSVFVAYDTNLALLELLRLFKVGLLILVIRHYVKTENDLLLVLGVLLGTLIAQGLLVVSQSFFDTSLGLGFLGENDALFIQERGAIAVTRAGGTLGHPNVLGYFCEMVLPIALAVFLWRERGGLKMIALSALGLGLLGAFLTYSRATWVAVLIGLFIASAATMLIRKRGRARNLGYIAVVLLGVAAIGFVFKDAIIQRLEVFSSGSWDFRLQTFGIAWNMIRAHPFLGIGANSYLAALPYYNSAGITSAAAQFPVHNIFLLLTSETGLFGFITFIILLMAIASRAVHTMKTGPALSTATAIGVLAGAIAIVAHTMLDWLFRFDPVYMLFWFSVGLVLAAGQIQKKSST